MDAKTQKAELTRAAIVGAALDLAAAEGLEAISLQVVADRIGLSKSGVFSRVGSREALQKAVIEEFGHRFLAEVFVPSMQQPKGLPRLNEIVRRWIAFIHWFMTNCGVWRADALRGRTLVIRCSQPRW